MMANGENKADVHAPPFSIRYRLFPSPLVLLSPHSGSNSGPTLDSMASLDSPGFGSSVLPL